jgi:glycosyltransferase involved in cell wall biosynthesis
MKICIGIPAYKAQSTIEECLSSINIQSIRDEINVVISNDNPGDDYSYLKEHFPKLHLEFIDTDKNGGPGVARSKIIHNCKDNWIAFMDADDVLYSPFAIENLYKGTRQNGVIQSQAVFLQSVIQPNGETRLVPQNNPNHPWSFARLTNVSFLQQNKIDFGTLRAMEDGYMEWCIRLLVDGTQLRINYIKDIAYVWKEGSEHSITRTGVVNGIPQYNFDLCQLGAAVAAKKAIDFARYKNPFNGNILKFTVEQMVTRYFTYIECMERRPEFAEQNLWVAKYFYNECYKKFEQQVSEEALKKVYTIMNVEKSKSLIGIIPDITFFDWFNKIKTEEYGGKEELEKIRSKLPQEIIDNDVKTGVLSSTLDII